MRYERLTKSIETSYEEMEVFKERLRLSYITGSPSLYKREGEKGGGLPNKYLRG